MTPLKQKIDYLNILKLLKVANKREAGAHLEPLPNKTWLDCYVKEGGFEQLHYHIEGCNSSRMVYREY